MRLHPISRRELFRDALVRRRRPVCRIATGHPSGACRRDHPFGAREGQVCHPDLDVGRSRAPRHFRPQARSRQRLLRSAEQPYRDQRQRHPHRRAAAAARQTGRQVLAHPQHDARRLRPRNRVLHRADRPHVGRPRRLPQRRRGGLALQGLQRRVQGTDPALHRAHPTAGPLLRSRVPGRALQALRHRRRSRASPSSPWKAWSLPGISDERQQARREYLHQLDALERPIPANPVLEVLQGGREPGLRTDPRRRRQSLRPFAGEAGSARPLRHEHLRPILPRGPPPGGTRRPLHHHQLSRAAGTPTSRTSRSCAAACPRWTRACPRCFRIFPTAACSTAPSSGGTANSAAPPRSIGKPRGTADAAIGVESSPPSSPAADSRAARWSAPPTPRAKRSRTRPVYPVDLIGSMYELLGIDPRGQAAAPARPGCLCHARRLRGTACRRPTERDHVR